jgi:ABC-type cobalamin/Fe3+-siderophores transport system ATPase subunit
VGPHPILVIAGEQGAAKTTLLRVCRRLIDHNASPVRAQPKELRDLMIAARKGCLMAYDSITTVTTWLSSGLCSDPLLMSRTAPSPHRIDPENRHDQHVETRSAALTRRRTAQPRR